MATPRSPLRLLATLALLLGPACHDHHAALVGSTVPWTRQILPSSPTLAVTQLLQFRIDAPWAPEATWTVRPASAGSISNAGLFTASDQPGTCTVTANWAQDPSAFASTQVIVLAAVKPVAISPDLALASGAFQVVPAGTSSNAALAGEGVPATTSRSADQVIVVRHGFQPIGD